MNSPGGPWRWRLFPESLCDSNCESDALDNEYASHLQNAKKFSCSGSLASSSAG
jgi:hypothetical protein